MVDGISFWAENIQGFKYTFRMDNIKFYRYMVFKINN